MALTGSNQLNRPLTGAACTETPGVPASRPTSPWLTLQSAAAHMGYDGDPRKDADAVRQLAKRHQLPLYRRGRRLLISRTDLDRWLRGNRVAG